MELYKTDLFSYMKNDVKSSYQATDRFFHTMEHLALGFKDIEKYSIWYQKHISTQENDIGCNINQIAAWFYHDVYYDALNASENEKKSAEIAEYKLKNVNAINVETVMQIILDTKEHIPTIQDSNLILDIDMASLGYKFEDFMHYRKKAWSEYEKFYNEDQLIAGTKTFIKKTLGLPKLYNLSYFIDKYEDQARKNLNKYLNVLSK